MDRNVSNYKWIEYDNTSYCKVYSIMCYSCRVIDCESRFFILIIISHNVVYIVSNGSTLLKSKNVNINKYPLNGLHSGILKV